MKFTVFGIYPTNDALADDTKGNYLVTLTLTFMLKIAFSDFVAVRGHSVSQM